VVDDRAVIGGGTRSKKFLISCLNLEDPRTYLSGGEEMKRNVGSADSIVRPVLGLAVIAAGLHYQNWFGLVGIVLLGTAVIGWCPATLPFGLSTCKMPSQGSSA
jgi:hypothetical protein